MNIKIIDHIRNSWILGKVSLLDYLEGLSDESFSFAIQRGIVTNRYLSTILDAISDDSPLPPISLIAGGDIDTSNDKVDVVNFDILDGLQRTYRLWIYLQLSDIALKNPSFSYREVSAYLRTKDANFTKVISPRQIRELFNVDAPINYKNLRQKYSDYNIYVYMWLNLPEKEAIKKMLILNAGQKKMPIQNQYELMYLHTFEHIDLCQENIELVRVKDNRADSIKKGDRQIGQYLIPTVIIGIQSLIAGKPVRLSNDMLYEANSDYSDDYISESGIDLFFDEAFIKSLIVNLYNLDAKLSVNNHDNLKWLSKDTVISGIMGGCGRYIRERYIQDIDFAQNANTLLDTLIRDHIRHDSFRIDEYEQQYSMLSSVRINIGMIVRKAICEYTYTLFCTGTPNWEDAFMTVLNKS